MKRKIICQDLRDNSIDVSTIGEIAKDVCRYPIYNFRLGIRKFYMTAEHAKRRPQKNTVELMFSKPENSDNNGTTITLFGKVRFSTNSLSYTVNATIDGYAEYNYRPYDQKIQEYLYTYFVEMVENERSIYQLFPLRLPTTLMNYSHDNHEVIINQTYQWIDTGDLLEVSKLPLKHPVQNFLKFWKMGTK